MEDMKANIKCGFRLAGFLGALSGLGFLIPCAEAATRTAYFNQTGQNKTVNGLADPGAQSTCRVTINNPSNVNQTYVLAMNVSSLDSWAGGDSGTSVPGSYREYNKDASVDAPTSSSGKWSGNLDGGEAITIIYTFSSYPSRRNATNPTTTGYQKLRCSGSIEATDTTQPGFLVATGVLVTFVESTKMGTDGVTGGSTQNAEFGGMAVYTQVTIAINRGKTL
jgi:hypothetical protein